MLKFLGLESKEKERNIETLLNMGFTREQALNALHECENDPRIAVNYLLQRQVGKP
jgi:uncharacterized UBP type Zn finger protein